VRPRSLLAVMAHPDDAELWAGGTLAAHAAADTQVTIAIAAHDRIRDAEATAGAGVLGAELCVLPAMSAETIGALLADLRPEVVITHPSHDVHPDHRKVCDVLLQALPEAVIAIGCPRRVYTCDSYNGLTLDGPMTPHTIIDISVTFGQKMRALRVHRSQPIEDHFGPMAETLARLHGARIGTAYGEAFTPVPVLGRLPVAAHL
jgi:LmbE family N-acetylglucosaminyl deacetylase